MARRPTRLQLRRQFEALAAQYEPMARDAFLDAVRDITDSVGLGRAVEALERGDIDAAIRALHLDPAAFRGLETAIAAAYGAGGVATTGSLPRLRDPSGGAVVVRFDVRAPRAEEWLRLHSSTLITRIVDEQREVVRQALQQGLIDGRNPRATALDIVGRIDRASNRRTGGVIGLSGPQAQAVEKARSALSSGDATAMREYLGLTRRDKRFDATIARAIRDGKAPDAATIHRVIGRYADRLLQLRGETIARTETLMALSEAKEEAFRQAIDTGAVQAQHVTKVWRATHDNRTRGSHAAIDGEAVRMDQPFSNGLMYPHQEGAPASEVISCRCDVDYRIDFLAGLAQ